VEDAAADVVLQSLTAECRSTLNILELCHKRLTLYQKNANITGSEHAGDDTTEMPQISYHYGHGGVGLTLEK